MDGANDWADIPQIEDATAPDAQAEVKRLAALEPAAYETARKDAAARLGWRATFLDAEVTKARPRKADAGEDDDTPEAIETIEAWPDPVGGASLAEEIRDRLRAHVIFASSADADCAALWIIGSYAAKAAPEDDDSEPAGVMMLRDISEIFASRGADRIATAEIVSELLMMEDRPWMEWRHGRPITAQSVAKQMKPFGIRATVKKLGGTANQTTSTGKGHQTNDPNA